MAKADEILLHLRAENKQLKSKLTESQKGIETMSKKGVKSLGGLSRGFKGLLTGLGIFAVIAAVKKLISVTDEQQTAEAQLNAVLESTKNAAGLTSTELKDMAASLQTVTRFGDETIIKAQSLLLTFTKIGKEVFPQATETVLNMAQAMGTDLKTQAIQVGKALNDPILGVTALRRVGVQLTAQQEKSIKSFVAVNDIAGAQGIILEELETQFGGVARSASQTLGGKFEQLGNTLGDTAETIGTELTPDLKRLADTFITAGSGGGVFSKALGAITVVARFTIKLLTNMLNTLNRMFDDKLNARIESHEERYNSLIKTGKKWVAIREKNLKTAKDEHASEEEITRLTRLLNNEKEELASNTNLSNEARKETKKILDDLKGKEKEYSDGLDEEALRVKKLTEARVDLNNKTKELKDIQLSTYLTYLGLEHDALLAKLDEDHEAIISNHRLTKEQKEALDAEYLKKREELTKVNQEAIQALQTQSFNLTKNAFNQIETANKQLIYSMMWGPGGWNEFKQSVKDTMKRLLADITYAIARAIVLQTVLGAAGGGGGLISRFLFKEGHIPSFKRGRTPDGSPPVYARGDIPSDHFPAFIGTGEAVINEQSTRANIDLLRNINSNPGQKAGGGGTTNLNIYGALVDGEKILDIVDEQRDNKARRLGTSNYPRTSIY